MLPLLIACHICFFFFHQSRPSCPYTPALFARPAGSWQKRHRHSRGTSLPSARCRKDLGWPTRLPAPFHHPPPARPGGGDQHADQRAAYVDAREIAGGVRGQFSVLSFQFSVFSFQFSVFGFRFSVFGFRLLISGVRCQLVRHE